MMVRQIAKEEQTLQQAGERASDRLRAIDENDDVQQQPTRVSPSTTDKVFCCLFLCINCGRSYRSFETAVAGNTTIYYSFFPLLCHFFFRFLSPKPLARNYMELLPQQTLPMTIFTPSSAVRQTRETDRKRNCRVQSLSRSLPSSLRKSVSSHPVRTLPVR